MLEKIGLPERPSLRGNNWVVDASHCQGCSSQFTFINRKHHCRRCGGLFCGSCTQQRMVLRGQGDSPVRICDPCKKLEEAARFELRYGHKKKTGRGGSKLTSRHEDEALEQILGSDRKELVSAQSNASSSSSPILQEDKAYDQGEERSLETGSASPEQLRQQALEEKKKYKFLKAEGKPEEALRAFKRGKELERQAGALELSLRKNRRKFVSLINTAEIQKTNDETSFGRKNALDSHKSKDKEDLSSELKELGWSDLDLRNAEKKPATMSLEGELSTLLGEVSQKTSTEKTSRVSDKSQVVSHKKRALALKREGKLAEAKEELKKAKILEKQQEEEEFLAEAEDSDDELSALIRSMDSDKQDNLSVNFETDLGFNFDRLINDDIDHNFEVTDEDMYDPEMDTALKSLGWTDESDQFEDVRPRLDREMVLVKIQSLKREAVNQKKVGNIVEAMELLRQAKLLEKDLDNYPPTASENPPNQNKDDVGIINVMAKMEAKSAPKSRLMIQKELLSVKKTALALRREGKVDEANEELKKGTILEQQLEEMDNASKGKAKPVEVSHKRDENITLPDNGDEGEEDVTDHDMHDPGYLAVLKNLGWDDEDDKNVPVRRVEPSSTQAASSLPIVAPKKSKGEIQRELLGLKRKALSLRRQGEIEKAEEVQKMTKVLEAQLEEMEVPKKEEKSEIEKHVENEFFSSLRENFVQKDDGKGMLEHLSEQIAGVPVHLDKLKDDDLRSNNKITLRKREEVVLTNENPRVGESDSVHKTVHGDDQSFLRQEILILKRNAVALKKAGKLAEAKEELRKAKLLEKNSQGSNSDPGTSSSDASSTTPNVTSVGDNNNSSPNSVSKPLTSRDRFKLQQESLGHKRLSRKLRMEGRHEEADTEFELAKSIEAQLEESADKSSSSRSKSVDDVGVEDFLDPQLLSALNAIGIADTGTISQSPEKTDPVKSTASKGENSAMGKTQLEEQIKEERLKAVTLKRSGNQAEALDALRRAKMLEKKLNFLSS